MFVDRVFLDNTTHISTFFNLIFTTSKFAIPCDSSDFILRTTEISQ